MILNKVNKLNAKIDELSSNNGINQKVTIVAVTKNRPVECFSQLLAAGIFDIGENRVQALAERSPFIFAKKHLIGHLQTNKVRDAIKAADLIQSVDSIHLAKEIQSQAEKMQKTVEILIQVNIAKEESKFGIFIEDIQELLKTLSEIKNIKVKGLMAIMPIDKKLAYYNKMYELYLDIQQKKLHNIDMEILSMGMSNDFEEAVMCGANMIRIGTYLFTD